MYQSKALYTMLDGTAAMLYWNPNDKLINYFTKKKDISFMYIMHEMDSSSVAYFLNKNNSSTNQSPSNKKCIFVYKAAVES